MLTLIGCGTFSADEGGPATSDASTGGPDGAASDADADAGATSNNDGGGTETGASDPLCNGAPNCKRVVFATSEKYNGNLGGRSGANQTCQTLAGASPLPRIKGRQFLAYLSVVNDVVGANLTKGGGPYVRADGMQIASDWADLFTSGLTVPIALDEKGASVPVGELAWTGTTSSGTLSGDYCAGWLDATSPQGRGMVGDVNDALFWTNRATSTCGELRHLYCFEY